jgi:uncharacterized protein YdaU (DUF1376 family)
MQVVQAVTMDTRDDRKPPVPLHPVPVRFASRDKGPLLGDHLMPPKRDFEPLPYYRWYWRDWRSSRSVQRMSYVARGLYRELLDECWVKGHIPTDLALLADICDCPVSVLRTHWNTLEPLFVLAGEGMLISERLEHERTDSDKARVAKSLAGKRSGEARKLKRVDANSGEQPLTGVPTGGTESNALLSSSSSEQSTSSSVSTFRDMLIAAGVTPVQRRRIS